MRIAYMRRECAENPMKSVVFAAQIGGDDVEIPGLSMGHSGASITLF